MQGQPAEVRVPVALGVQPHRQPCEGEIRGGAHLVGGVIREDRGATKKSEAMAGRVMEWLVDGTGRARKCCFRGCGYAGQRQRYYNGVCLNSWACGSVDESRDIALGACLRGYYKSIHLGWGYADKGGAKILGKYLIMIDGKGLWPWRHIEEVGKDALGVWI